MRDRLIPERRFSFNFTVQSSAAAARRQAGHRQSVPAAGIGSFAVSSMHQQWPDRSQVNAVPQRGQFKARCDAGFADDFVTIPFTIPPNPSCDVQASGEHSPSVDSYVANPLARSTVRPGNGA